MTLLALATTLVGGVTGRLLVRSIGLECCNEAQFAGYPENNIGHPCTSRLRNPEIIHKSYLMVGSIYRLKGRTINYASDHNKSNLSIDGRNTERLANLRHQRSHSRDLDFWRVRKEDRSDGFGLRRTAISIAPFFLPGSSGSARIIGVHRYNVLPRQNMQRNGLPNVFQSIFDTHNGGWSTCANKREVEWFNDTVGDFYPRPQWSPQIRPMVVTSKPANEKVIRTSHSFTLPR